MKQKTSLRIFILAVATALLSSMAFATGAWFDDFNRGYGESDGDTSYADFAGPKNGWAGADGKGKGVLDTTHAIEGNSLLVSQHPTEDRPYRVTELNDDEDAPFPGLVSLWFYDDGVGPKGFEIRLIGAAGSYVGIGLRGGANYVSNIDGTASDTGIPRSIGWHAVQFAVNGTNGTDMRLDGQTWTGHEAGDFKGVQFLQIRTDFGNPTDENKVWIDSVRWQYGNGHASLPKPLFIAYVENFDANALAWGTLDGNKTRWLDNLVGHMNIPQVPWGVGDEQGYPWPSGAMDSNAHEAGPRAIRGDYASIFPMKGDYLLGFWYKNGDGIPERPWPNLNVDVVVPATANVNLGSAAVGPWTHAITPAFVANKGDDLQINITGDAAPSPITQAERDKFIRVDQFYLALESFKYQLEYSAATGGSISGAALQAVAPGGNATPVEAIEGPGYTFTGWSDGVLTAARTDLAVDGHFAVVAQFTLNQYTLTYTAGAGGSIVGVSPQTVNHGTDGSAVTAQPALGYHFVQWSDSSTDNPRTDTNVQGNVTVEAQFALNQYTLTYTAGADGSILGVSPQTVNHGADGTAVEAMPDLGYKFVQWSDLSTDNPRQDTNVTGNITVTASFIQENEYTVTYNAGIGGLVNGAATVSQTVVEGNDGPVVTASANPGYTFVDWSDSSIVNPRQDTNVTGNITVTANFAANTYTVTFDPGAGVVNFPTKQVTFASPYGELTTATLANHTFGGWYTEPLGAGDLVEESTSVSIADNHTLFALWNINQYTLTYTAGPNGSVNGLVEVVATVDHGADGPSVVPQPDPGFLFLKWSDETTDNPRQDTNVTGNITVTAEFELDVSSVEDWRLF